MPCLKVNLSQIMYDELLDAANRVAPDPAEVGPHHLRPEEFARECIEAVLADRRLERTSA